MTARSATRSALVGIATAIAVASLTACSVSGEAPLAQPSSTPAADAGQSGDEELLRAVGNTFGDEHDRAAVALIDGDEVRTAFVNADASTMFELGPITKALTGLLLADGIERGEVALDDPIGAHLALDGADAASVRLEQLATHHSGLPPWPSDPAWASEFDAALAANEDAIGDDDDVVAQAAAEDLPAEAGFENSYLGSALLGLALAAAAGSDYRSLLQARVFEPAGMSSAVLVETAEDVPEQHAGGYAIDGSPVEPWTFGEYAPAAGVAATIDDMSALARSVLDGPFRDSAALEPLVELDDRFSIGYQWALEKLSSRTVTGQEGGTGGFSSMLLIDRAAGTASIVLWNAPGDAYEVALRMLPLAE